MSVLNYTARDVFKVNDQIIPELANGESISLTFENDLISLEKGKNGNSLYAFNEQGVVGALSVRVLRGGKLDRLLNRLLQAQINDFEGSSFIKLEFIKKIKLIGNSIVTDTYRESNALISKLPDTQSNATGDVEQNVVVYDFTLPAVKILKG